MNSQSDQSKEICVLVNIYIRAASPRFCNAAFFENGESFLGHCYNSVGASILREVLVRFFVDVPFQLINVSGGTFFRKSVYYRIFNQIMDIEQF